LEPGTTEIVRNLYAVEKIDNSTDVYLGRPSSLNVTNVINNQAQPEILRTPNNFTVDPLNTWKFDEFTVLNGSGNVTLGNNPLATVNLSSVVTVTVPTTAGLQNEQQVTIAGATDTNNITAVELNITAPITIVDGTHFSFISNGTANATGSGGGNAVTYNLGLPVTYVVGVAAPNLLNINNQTQRLIYWGNKDAATAFTEISTSHQTTSGGIVVSYPYFFKYGNNGVVSWTLNPGGDWSDAVPAKVASTKIVQGYPTRAGVNAPGVLFWSLRSLIRATFNGGAAVFTFDTIQQGVPILAQNSVVTTENAYYWISNDQFWVYDGVVRQLENYQNRLFFFKNLNNTYRNKIWGEYRSEYHEIWWHFPMGTSTECNHAIVLNLETNFWFDTPSNRSAGYIASNYSYPLLSDSKTLLNVNNPTTPMTVQLANNPLTTDGVTAIVTVSYPSTQTLQNGNSITIAGAVDTGGIVAANLNIVTTIFNVNTVTQTFQYTANAASTGVANGGGAAVVYTIIVPNLCYGLWQEETGLDDVSYGNAFAIKSYYQTNLISWIEKFPQDDRQIRIRRIEPDFVQSGDMTVVINTQSFAQSDTVSSTPYTYVPGQTTIEMAKVDTTNMGRLVSFTFQSNVVGGDYLMGKIFYDYAPGDVRP